MSAPSTTAAAVPATPATGGGGGATSTTADKKGDGVNDGSGTPPVFVDPTRVATAAATGATSSPPPAHKVLVTLEPSGDPDEIVVVAMAIGNAAEKGHEVWLLVQSSTQTISPPRVFTDRHFVEQFGPEATEEHVSLLVDPTGATRWSVLSDQGFNAWVKKHGFPVYLDLLKRFLLKNEDDEKEEEDNANSRDTNMRQHHLVWSLERLFAPLAASMGVSLKIVPTTQPCKTPFRADAAARSYLTFLPSTLGEDDGGHHHHGSLLDMYDDATVGQNLFDAAVARTASLHPSQQSRKKQRPPQATPVLNTPERYDVMARTLSSEAQYQLLAGGSKVHGDAVVHPDTCRQELAQHFRDGGTVECIIAGTPTPFMEVMPWNYIGREHDGEKMGLAKEWVQPSAGCVTQVTMMMAAWRLNPDLLSRYVGIDMSRPSMNIGSEQTNFNIDKQGLNYFAEVFRKYFPDVPVIVVPTEPCKQLATFHRRDIDGTHWGTEFKVFSYLCNLWGHMSARNAPSTRKHEQVGFDPFMLMIGALSTEERAQYLVPAELQIHTYDPPIGKGEEQRRLLLHAEPGAFLPHERFGIQDQVWGEESGFLDRVYKQSLRVWALPDMDGLPEGRTIEAYDTLRRRFLRAMARVSRDMEYLSRGFHHVPVVYWDYDMTFSGKSIPSHLKVDGSINAKRPEECRAIYIAAATAQTPPEGRPRPVSVEESLPVDSGSVSFPVYCQRMQALFRHFAKYSHCRHVFVTMNNLHTPLAGVACMGLDPGRFEIISVWNKRRNGDATATKLKEIQTDMRKHGHLKAVYVEDDPKACEIMRTSPLGVQRWNQPTGGLQGRYREVITVQIPRPPTRESVQKQGIANFPDKMDELKYTCRV